MIEIKESLLLNENYARKIISNIDPRKLVDITIKKGVDGLTDEIIKLSRKLGINGLRIIKDADLDNMLASYVGGTGIPFAADDPEISLKKDFFTGEEKIDKPLAIKMVTVLLHEILHAVQFDVRYKLGAPGQDIIDRLIDSGFNYFEISPVSFSTALGYYLDDDLSINGFKSKLKACEKIAKRMIGKLERAGIDFNDIDLLEVDLEFFDNEYPKFKSDILRYLDYTKYDLETHRPAVYFFVIVYMHMLILIDSPDSDYCKHFINKTEKLILKYYRQIEKLMREVH